MIYSAQRSLCRHSHISTIPVLRRFADWNLPALRLEGYDLFLCYHALANLAYQNVHRDIQGWFSHAAQSAIQLRRNFGQLHVLTWSGYW